MSKTTTCMAWLTAGLLALASPAAAHDWYPMECCHGMDCAAVEKVEILPGPAMATLGPVDPSATGPSAMVVTTKHGTVLVPADFPRRESQDNRMHACMRPTGAGTMKLLCIFMPPST